MCLDDVEVAIEIVVSNAHAHPTQHPAVTAQERRHATEAFFTKSSVVVVQQQVTRRGITSHEKIRPAVLVRIEPQPP